MNTIDLRRYPDVAATELRGHAQIMREWIDSNNQGEPIMAAESLLTLVANALVNMADELAGGG